MGIQERVKDVPHFYMETHTFTAEQQNLRMGTEDVFQVPKT